MVGAAEATGSAVASNAGWQYKVSFMLLLIASLNIFVGAFNMLPLLPLDGGHIAVIVYERIRAWLARLRGGPTPAWSTWPSCCRQLQPVHRGRSSSPSS